MRIRRVAVLAGILGLAVWVAAGCSDVNQLMDPDPEFVTLTVAYQSPGPSASPCDDILPIVDGVAQDAEWGSAPPHFVRMSGADGNGGKDFYLEVRALWTNEGRLGGSDRIYFLIRYHDNDLNAQPDELAYVQEADPLELCQPFNPDGVIINGVRYCNSPPPIDLCDPGILDPDRWTRINSDGREDQVMVLLTKSALERPGLPDEPVPSNLTVVNGELLDVVGPETPDGVTVRGSETDVWIWRAGRTNLHPVPQFADWDNLIPPKNDRPVPIWSTFTFKSGFCEDLWVDEDGLLVDDDGEAGLKPFVTNFNRTDPVTGEPFPDVPERLTECPPFGRDPTDEEVVALNGGVAKDLGLWWPTTKRFIECDVFACSRIGARPGPWGLGLLPGEYDKVQGWGLAVPYNIQTPNLVSGRDVRAKATYEETQEKGFGVRVLEIMRDLNTGNADDLVIDPTNTPGVYRIVIGVFDDSGQIGSGSREIRLEFEAPEPMVGAIDRC
jgi:hypothetical protein